MHSHRVQDWTRTWGADETTEDTWVDGNGHGTHVASLAAGTKYGVAKKASLVAVRVLDSSGSGTNAGVIAGIDFVTKQYKATKQTSVANMSLGGGKSAVLDAAVNGSITAGVSYAIAAGNENQNACNTSPANVARAVTVGATELDNKGNSQIDARSDFSNFGPCVKIFAPGTQLTAAWMTSDTAIKTISGTSMASPVVCGVMALLLGDDPSITPDQMRDILIKQSSQDQIDLENCPSTICDNTANRMVYALGTVKK